MSVGDEAEKYVNDWAFLEKNYGAAMGRAVKEVWEDYLRWGDPKANYDDHAEWVTRLVGVAIYGFLVERGEIEEDKSA